MESGNLFIYFTTPTQHIDLEGKAVAPNLASVTEQLCVPLLSPNLHSNNVKSILSIPAIYLNVLVFSPQKPTDLCSDVVEPAGEHNYVAIVIA